jgi:hypothetical protein
MRTQQILDRVRQTARTYGRRAALHDVQLKLLNHVGRVNVLRGMVVTMEDVADPGLFEAPGFEGRFVEGDELARVTADPAYDMTAGFVREATWKGDRCYGLFEGDTLAAYGWYSSEPTRVDDSFVLRFDPRYTYMYKGFTLPAYRGKRLHAVGMCQALRAFTQEGKRGLVSYVMSTNFASLRSTERMGYRIFGDLYLVEVAGSPFSHATSGCAAYDFRLEADPRPALTHLAPALG